ncbi:MAG: hypothetical protein KJZ92_01450 [Rhodocyclaceae bacterium]|nr:hypothetical protein [Rhodocyclaceae bacterium]MCL4679909.1 hypothetical protein [Rhodocyclaceae bacterium]
MKRNSFAAGTAVLSLSGTTARLRFFMGSAIAALGTGLWLAEFGRLIA